MVHENFLCLQVIHFSFGSVWNKEVESFRTDREWRVFLSLLAVIMIIAAMSVLVQKNMILTVHCTYMDGII